jgi:hypothetical protein
MLANERPSLLCRPWGSGARFASSWPPRHTSLGLPSPLVPLQSRTNTVTFGAPTIVTPALSVSVFASVAVSGFVSLTLSYLAAESQQQCHLPTATASATLSRCLLLSLSLSLSFARSLALSPPPSLILCVCVGLSFCLSPSFCLCLPLFLSLSLSHNTHMLARARRISAECKTPPVHTPALTKPPCY